MPLTTWWQEEKKSERARERADYAVSKDSYVAPLTVEDDHAEDSEVEEDSRPSGRVDHGEYDGHHEYDHLDK